MTWTAGLWVLVGLLVAVAGFFMVRWIMGALQDRVTLAQRGEALKVESDRISVMEAAAAKERAERAKAFDEAAAKVSSSVSAVELLRLEATRARGSETDRPVQNS